MKMNKAFSISYWPLAVSLIRHHLEYGCLQRAQEIAECVLEFNGREYGLAILPWAAFLARVLDELGDRSAADRLRSEVCDLTERKEEWKDLRNVDMKALLWRISQYHAETHQTNEFRYNLRQRPIQKGSTKPQAH
ncbi:hypothetical protein E8E15_000254 [Penicillium rubens]|jgi:hypothetical protein|nr:hypothetical protein E8E15_000254 [Penicillium rubens]